MSHIRSKFAVTQYKNLNFILLKPIGESNLTKFAMAKEVDGCYCNALDKRKRQNCRTKLKVVRKRALKDQRRNFEEYLHEAYEDIPYKKSRKLTKYSEMCTKCSGMCTKCFGMCSKCTNISYCSPSSYQRSPVIKSNLEEKIKVIVSDECCKACKKKLSAQYTQYECEVKQRSSEILCTAEEDAKPSMKSEETGQQEHKSEFLEKLSRMLNIKTTNSSKECETKNSDKQCNAVTFDNECKAEKMKSVGSIKKPSSKDNCIKNKETIKSECYSNVDESCPPESVTNKEEILMKTCSESSVKEIKTNVECPKEKSSENGLKKFGIKQIASIRSIYTSGSEGNSNRPSVTSAGCQCYRRSTSGRRKRRNCGGDLHKPKSKVRLTLKPVVYKGKNRYLNYFRAYYSQKGGRIVVAAKEAGANWRNMCEDEKAKYECSIEDTKHRGNKKCIMVFSRVKRLNNIFRLLLPNNKCEIRARNIRRVRTVLEQWTKDVYKEVIGTKDSNDCTSMFSKYII